MAVFPAIGLLAVLFSSNLGNGRSLTQILFDSELGITLAVTLVVSRLLVTLGALYAGAEGGLSYARANGRNLTWDHGWGALESPMAAVPQGAFAIVGGAAFLASSMKMPLTAIALMIEFTRVGHDFLISICLAVAGPISVSCLLAERNRTAHETVPLSRQPEELESPSRVHRPSEETLGY